MAQWEDLGHGHQMGLGSSYDARNFPGRPVVKTVFPGQGAQVQSLIRKLRSQMLYSKAKKKKNYDASTDNLMTLAMLLDFLSPSFHT